MSKVYELVGYYEEPEYQYGGYTGNSETVERVVATFDSEKAAHDYASNARLKGPYRDRIAGRLGFRKRSLLNGYEGYEVRVRGHADAPHNPEV